MAADRMLTARNDVEPELPVIPNCLIEVINDNDQMINPLNHKRLSDDTCLQRSAKFKLLLNIAEKAQLGYLRRLNFLLYFACGLGLNNGGLHGGVGSTAVAAHSLDDQVVALLGLLAIQFPKTLRESGHLLGLLANEHQ